MDGPEQNGPTETQISATWSMAALRFRSKLIGIGTSRVCITGVGSQVTTSKLCFNLSIAMLQPRILIYFWLLTGVCIAEGAEPDRRGLVERAWFEARTAHFNAYSCGATQDVFKLVGRLEQFREAYFMLAGAQAVSSPPIVVIAFPDHASMEPFLPVYQGKPANLAAFFKRASDENLIVLYLSGSGSGSLGLIFHEYTHLLLRHNQRFWPLWLTEGMAEIYSTFELTGSQTVRIAKPIDSHLRILSHTPLMPLKNFFAVTHDSPEYNERDRQGIFYAESWLLVHYLISGASPVVKSHFSHLTALLRQGQLPEQAFTNAFQTGLGAMEKQLQLYLERKRFEPLLLSVRSDLAAPRATALRTLAPAEICFRLGDELLRIGQFEAAQSYFEKAKKLAPNSPIGFEGLGLLAAERGSQEEAVRWLGEALKHGSVSFLAHYTYARERFSLTASSPGRYSRVETEVAKEIRSKLEKSLALMPDFGPAHHLLGFFELVQGENPAAAEKHLERAIQLEPENQSYPFSLAQAKLLKMDLDGARKTLESLRLPYVEAQLRQHAEEMLKEIGTKK